MRAWAAFRSPDPRGLVNLVREGSLALRFLGAALVRHLEQFPSERDGLGRSERTLLEAVAGGARRPAAAFAFQHEREERPFLGDTWAWAHLDRLAAGPAPLLVRANGSLALGRHEPGFQDQELTLTQLARDVLAGRADALSVRGADLWLGGVHLQGRQGLWRWLGHTATVARR